MENQNLISSQSFQPIHRPHHRLNFKHIIITIVSVTVIIVAILIISSYINKKNTIPNSKISTFANTLLSIKSKETSNIKVGENLVVDLLFETENESKVDAVQAHICYGNELVLDENSGVIANEESGFSMVVVDIKNNGTKQTCATVVATSNKSSGDLSSSAKVMTLTFFSSKAGTGNIIIDKDKSMVTGDNPNSPSVKTLAITGVEDLSYEISK